MSRLALVPINIPARSSAPSGAVAGDLYYDTGTGNVYVYSGSAWVASAITTGTLAQFAATTSAQLAGVISDETGSGALVFASSPALAGTPTAPTAAGGTSTTQIATTEFVAGEVHIFTGFDGGSATTSTYDLTLDLGSAA